eukprot:325460_1
MINVMSSVDDEITIQSTSIRSRMTYSNYPDQLRIPLPPQASLTPIVTKNSSLGIRVDGAAISTDNIIDEIIKSTSRINSLCSNDGIIVNIVRSNHDHTKCTYIENDLFNVEKKHYMLEKGRRNG